VWNKAATARTWKITIATKVIQLILSRLPKLTSAEGEIVVAKRSLLIDRFGRCQYRSLWAPGSRRARFEPAERTREETRGL
jgi:hypothetical protein